MRRITVVVAVAVAGSALAAALAATAPAPQANPDPEAEARADGCGRDYFAQTRREIPTWVFVGDRDAPATGPAPAPRRLKGRIASRYDPDFAVHPTEEDLPTIHRGYDFNFDVLPDPAYAGLLAGNPGTTTGNFAGRSASTARLHVEREEHALPRFAWPEVGDRVTLVGSWVWDCGHWTPGGEKTELHSYRALWLERNAGRASPYSRSGESEGDLFLSSDKTFAGVQADCAHRAKGVSAVFMACLASAPAWQDLSGNYSFRLRVPPRPRRGSRLVVRVVDAGSSAGAPRAKAVVRGKGVDVSLNVAATRGRPLVVAQRVLARWTGAAEPVHLRVRFLRLLVRRAMDPGCPRSNPKCPSRQTTRGEQDSRSPGEWNVYVNAAGVWKTWGKGLLRVRDGQVFQRGPVLDVHLLRGRPWRIFAFARECDFGSLGNADGAAHAMAPCPRSTEIGSFEGDDSAGVAVLRLRSPAAALGTHRLRPRRRGSTCPAVNRLGCYELLVRVLRVR
jgi:hypothetical protein